MANAKFLLMSGKHHRGIGMRGTRQTIEPGQVFVAISEKEAEFCRKYPDRYQEVRSEAIPVVRTSVKTNDKDDNAETVEIDLNDLMKMTTIQLMNFAKQNGIELKGANNKETIIKAIREAAEQG